MSELNGEHPSDPVVSTEISPEKPPVLPPEIATTTLPSDARISERKLEANRANSRRSTGPTSPRGKAHSSRNAIRHGFLAVEIVSGLGGNSREYKRLLAQLRELFNPADILDDLLVQEVANYSWKKKQLLRAEIGETHKQRKMIDRAPAGPDREVDILGIWLGMRHDHEKRRLGGDGGLQSSRLTDIEEQIIKRFKETRFGALTICRSLREIHNTVLQTRTLSQEDRDLLHDCCGRSASLLFPREFPSDGKVNTPEQLTEFLGALASEYQSTLAKFRSLGEDVEINDSRLAVPLERSDLLVRYDSHCSREFYRALSKLESRQRRKAGEAVVPPIKVDIT